MTAPHPLLSRLETGRPLLASADPYASLRARGIGLKMPMALARFLREAPALLVDHYRLEIAAGVDVLCAFTSETFPRALHEIGMPFRAAALTSCAVDLALDAAETAPRAVIAAGVLGCATIAPTAADRVVEDLATHAARLATAGCEMIIARGFGLPGAEPGLARLARRASVSTAVATQLPTWALIEINDAGFTIDAEPLADAARAAIDAGAQLLIFEGSSLAAAPSLLDRALTASGGVPIGLSPSGALEDGAAAIDAWAAAAKSLIDGGARVIGGGPGVTGRHMGALAALLRPGERQSFWPRAG